MTAYATPAPRATGLAAYVPPLPDRALADGGLDLVHEIAERLSTVGGRATAHVLRRNHPNRVTGMLLALENAGFAVITMGLANHGYVTLTDAGWAIAGGKPTWGNGKQ